MFIITGQTGTGKTSLALKLAAQHNGELLSADSRQVFKEMDIGTGKADTPDELELKDTVWHLKGVPIYSINLITPNQVFSAGDFADLGHKVIADMQARGKTPIVVGGTGFYLKSLFDPDDTVFVPQNDQLRSQYEKQSVSELQMLLTEKDQVKWESMNNSDQNNPRRLVRALEVAEWKAAHPMSKPPAADSSQATWIGLTAPKDLLVERISARVQNMFDQGLEREVKLLTEKYSWQTPGLQTIGYREWQEYFAGTKTLEQVKTDIITAHLQYARKQMIYFKRLPQIEWREIAHS